MANIFSFNVNGASYSYDTESKNPLALKNVKLAVDGKLVYGADGSIQEKAEAASEASSTSKQE